MVYKIVDFVIGLYFVYEVGSRLVCKLVNGYVEIFVYGVYFELCVLFFCGCYRCFLMCLFWFFVYKELFCVWLVYFKIVFVVFLVDLEWNCILL